MIIKKKDENGNEHYFDGNKEVALKRVAGKATSYLPNYVYRDFRKPQPVGVNKVSTIIKEL